MFNDAINLGKEIVTSKNCLNLVANVCSTNGSETFIAYYSQFMPFMCTRLGTLTSGITNPHSIILKQIKTVLAIEEHITIGIIVNTYRKVNIICYYLMFYAHMYVFQITSSVYF